MSIWDLTRQFTIAQGISFQARSKTQRKQATKTGMMLKRTDRWMIEVGGWWVRRSGKADLV